MFNQPPKSRRPCLVPQLLPSRVGPEPPLNNAAPSVQSHYRTFNPTTSRSAPVPRIGTLVLSVLPIGFLPWHRDDRFSRSIQEPDPESRRLCAGCRSGSFRTAPELIPRDEGPLGFDIGTCVSTRRRTVCFRSPLRTTPDGVLPRLSLQR